MKIINKILIIKTNKLIFILKYCFTIKAIPVDPPVTILYGEINKLKPRADKNVPITNKLNF